MRVRRTPASAEVRVAASRVDVSVVNAQLQLMAYYVAKKLGRSINELRNLAKSVTVKWGD